jgi:hypothetical protein
MIAPFPPQLTIPDGINHPLQCIEACRGDKESNPHTMAVYSYTPKKCVCTKDLSLTQPYDDPGTCGRYTDTYEVYQINKLPKAKNCNELYYQRQCYFPSTYITSTFTFRVECRHSQAPALQGGVWDQVTEKLGLQALMFTHDEDIVTRGTGVHVEVSRDVICFIQ